MFIEVSSSMVEVVASPLIGPGGLGVMGANSFEILNNLDSSYGVVGRKALNSLLFLLFSSTSLFKFGQDPNIFINLHLNRIHRSGLPLLRRRSSNFKHLNI